MAARQRQTSQNFFQKTSLYKFTPLDLTPWTT